MKNGILKGFIRLFLIMAVIVAVIVVGIIQAKKFINTEEAKNLQADLLVIQAKVEITKGNYDMNKEQNPLKGYNLNQLPETINISEFLQKNIISQEQYDKYYLLDSTSLEQLELQDLVNKYEGYFIVNYENYEVMYTQGYENANGVICYKISDLNKAEELPQQGEKEPETENSVETVSQPVEEEKTTEESTAQQTENGE